jgi:hypothetical protein
VVEGEMDDPVGVGGGPAQVVEVGEVTAVRLGPQHLDRGGRRLGAGEADDLVSACDQFGNDGRPDVAAGSGDEHPHGVAPPEVI